MGNAEHAGGTHQAWISQIIAVDPIGAIISGGWDGEVRVWSATGEYELAQTGLHRGGIRQILAANNGKTIVTLEQDWQRFSDGGGVRVWSYQPENAVEYQSVVRPPMNIPPHPPAAVLAKLRRNPVTR
jgi:hypothetical protein